MHTFDNKIAFKHLANKTIDLHFFTNYNKSSIWTERHSLFCVLLYQEKAQKAMEAIWIHRSRASDLVGTVINIHNGDWVRRGENNSQIFGSKPL